MLRCPAPGGGSLGLLNKCSMPFKSTPWRRMPTKNINTLLRVAQMCDVNSARTCSASSSSASSGSALCCDTCGACTSTSAR